MGAPNGSTYDTSPAGLSAIYTALSGRNTRRFELPPERLSDDIGTLVIWDAREIPDEEWPDITAWVAQGNKVLIGGEMNQLEGHTRILSASPVRSAAVHPIGVGLDAVDAGPWAFSDLERAPLVHLVRDDGAPVLVSWPEGQGRIFWSADTQWLTNSRIGRSDNLDLAVSLLTPAAGKELAFDEYHHGYMAAERWYQILRGPLQVFVIQLGVALVIMYWAFGVRFGAPRPQPAGPPRAAVEYVHSMSQLYRRARARTVVLIQIHRWLRRELSRLLGGAGAFSNAEIARRAAMQTGLPAQQIQATLDRTDPDRKPEPTESELIALVREAEDLQRRMRNAGYRDQRNP